MEHDINVFIVEDAPDYMDHLNSIIASQPNMRVVGSAVNGQEALDKLRCKPEVDILILDIIMPFLSGEHVLKQINAENLIPNCRGKICYSGLVSQSILNSVQRFGGDIFLLKPYSDQMLLDNINDLSIKNHPDLQGNNLQKRISFLLHQLGMPAHLQGYTFLRTAIEFCYNDFKVYTSQVTKKLYPDIALFHKTTATRVERSMRNAIDISWSRGRMEDVESIFGFSVDLNKGKPTNSEFISLLADYLILREQERQKKIKTKVGVR